MFVNRVFWRLRIMTEFRFGLLLVILAPAAALGQDLEIRNDGWSSGGAAGFQAGFVSGEIAAVRLTPPGPLPCTVNRVRFLFGGAAGSRSVIVHVWDDTAGADNPGTELFAGSYQVTAADDAMQEVQLGVSGVSVSGPFRVGIEFTQGGTPCVARDGDGITAGKNFIKSGSWLKAEVLGVSGDWIIRAVTGTTVDPGSEVRNDGWTSGGAAGFQVGFVSGEIAAVRLSPAGPFPCTVDRIRFLFGGASGTRTVKLHIWDDAAMIDQPGAELHSGNYQVTASNGALQEIALGGALPSVSGPFRVGIEFTHSGAPSVARDDDGITVARNFVKAQGIGWVRAESLGVSGDWIIRAEMGCLEDTRFERGDTNTDGSTDISDAVAILNYLFLGVGNIPCLQAADSNDDGALDMSDAVTILGFLFLGGKTIEPPFGICGVDPTGHDLACDSFSRCD
jgi:hypothetical protein